MACKTYACDEMTYHMQQTTCRKTPVLSIEQSEGEVSRVFADLLIFPFGSMNAREENHPIWFSLQLIFPDLCKSEPTIDKILEQRWATSDHQVMDTLAQNAQCSQNESLSLFPPSDCKWHLLRFHLYLLPIIKWPLAAWATPNKHDPVILWVKRKSLEKKQGLT